MPFSKARLAEYHNIAFLSLPSCIVQQDPFLQINAIFSNLFITQNSDFDKNLSNYKQEISHFIIYQQMTIAKTKPTIMPAQPSATRNAVPTNL